VSRERRPGGKDACEAGHTHPSSLALAESTVLSERKRADSLALAYREQQGENDVLRAKLEAAQRERDHFREAWAAAQVRLDCGVDATEAVREERAAVVAWLQRMAGNARHWAGDDNIRAEIYDNLADKIEHDKHRRTGEDK
jgi:hypothetical protein